MYKIKINKSQYVKSILMIVLFFCSSFDLSAFASESEKEKLPKGIIIKQGKFINEKDNMEMAFIPEGEFIMGDNEGNYNEKPEHKVYLDSYFLDIYEVSNAQFEKFVLEAGYKPSGAWRRGYQSGQENYPVRFVTWNDAYSYAKWAGKRLPTEAEWEKAAKGGKNYKYPWGNDWNNSFAIQKESFESDNVNAFSESISGYKCFGMAGGVWEWVADWYDRFYYEAFPDGKVIKNPKGPEDGAEPEKRFLDTKTAAGNERSALKVICGGGNWSNFAKDNTRTAKRMWGNPHYWLNDTGFRCAKSINSTSDVK